MSGVDVSELSVRIGERVLVDNISFRVEPGRVLAIVGESGAGKSVAVRTLLGFAPAGATVTADVLSVDGNDLRQASDRTWRAHRGQTVALITQDALGALDPLRRVGAEVAEPLVIHGKVGRRQAAAEAVSALALAGVPEPELRATQYPHELSGGLRQRAVIASAVIAGPRVLVADEPTTALDATVQRRVMALLRQLADDARAVVLVSHDLAAVAGVADEIAVMHQGRIVEHGSAQQILMAPEHPYTRELWAASVRAAPGAERPGRVVLTASNLRRDFGARRAVDDVSVTLRAGSVLGIVGESGSGKTTLARLLLGVDRPGSGRVHVEASEARRGRDRQFVAQDPRSAFNPTWTIARSMREALRSAGVARKDTAARTTELLGEVELDPSLGERRPSALSGGQLQRAAIARALAADPRILILDEPLSALDVSVGARILRLLARLRDERGMAMALISHDLAVVGELADRVIVMQDGRVVEHGATEDVFANPQHAFTRELLDASGSHRPPSSRAARSGPAR